MNRSMPGSRVSERVRLLLTVPALWAVTAQAAQAHASEQGFVLLLPTDAYIAAGGAVVALTVLLLAVLPGRRSGPCRSGARRCRAGRRAACWRYRCWPG
jgi:hypothetical protein